jgi:ABC-type transport system involved in cytochrome c biogenesis permease subunit
MLSGVGTICFASSYAIAWALEISRLLFRSGVRGAFMRGFAGAGLVAHTAFLYYRAVKATAAPLSSEQDWYLVAAWALVVVYLYLAVLRPKAPFGLFLLPLTLGLIGAATFLAPSQPLARGPASKIWGAIHGVSIMLAVVAVLVGFMAGLMYLGQSRRLKHKRLPTGRLRLPSLEWLQRANSHAIVTSLLMLGVGILSGMVLNLINTGNEAARLAWNDPVILSTWLMFLWLLGAVVAIAVYRPARQGRKVAYLTVASFVFLVIMLTAGLLMDSRHWGRGEKSTKCGVQSTEYALSFPPSLGGRPC